jgi:Cu(I)-responsive transcriptional regulator
MNIGEAARTTGLSAKTLRYYESIGLLPGPRRQANGYREYDVSSVNRIKFLTQARYFGFSIGECRQLLQLHDNPTRRSAEVHELVEEKLREVSRRVDELQTMHAVLSELIGTCPNNENADCAIIDSLAGEVAQSMPRNIEQDSLSTGS